MRRVIHAAAPCPVPVKQAMTACWGPIIYENYSGSEAIGVADSEYGEQIKAAVQLREGAGTTPADLIAFCRERLAHPKCPRSVDLVDAPPRSETGKLLRRVLKERYRPAGAEAG